VTVFNNPEECRKKLGGGGQNKGEQNRQTRLLPIFIVIKKSQACQYARQQSREKKKSGVAPGIGSRGGHCLNNSNLWMPREGGERGVHKGPFR